MQRKVDQFVKPGAASPHLKTEKGAGTTQFGLADMGDSSANFYSTALSVVLREMRPTITAAIEDLTEENKICII
jgi:hypothetical protein